MVLADTSIWISHLRHVSRQFGTLLEETAVVVHPFTIGELVLGHLKNQREILSLLHALPAAPVVSQAEILYFIDRHSLWGRGIGFVDVHLLASASLMRVSLWTSDLRLKRAAVDLRLSYT